MSGNRTILIVIAVLLVGILGFLVVGTMQQHRTPGQKIGDGLHDIGTGVSDAAHNATH